MGKGDRVGHQDSVLGSNPERRQRIEIKKILDNNRPPVYSQFTALALIQNMFIWLVNKKKREESVSKSVVLHV